MFKYIIYFLALIALATGAMDLFHGVRSQEALGANLTAQGFQDPMLDNVFRFFAAVWFGLGLQLIYFVRDLPRYKPALMLLLGVIALGGVARLISMAQFGLPEATAGRTIIFAGLFAELIMAPMLMVWLSRMKLSYARE